MNNTPTFSDIQLEEIRALFTLALKEDRVEGDITSQAIFTESGAMSAKLVARENMVFAGAAVLPLLLEAYGKPVDIKLDVKDGDTLKANSIIGIISGPTIAVLALERILLNILQRLCGVATTTRQYVDAVAGTQAKILDTRKTIPGWRVLDKYAVRCGGGENHRIHLADAIMIKDNHIAVCGGIEQAVEKALVAKQEGVPIIVECDTLEQVEIVMNYSSPLGGEQTKTSIFDAKSESWGVNNHVSENTPHASSSASNEACSQLLPPKGGAIDRILLDNMSLKDMQQAVDMVAGQIPLEASGGVSLDTVRKIAETGVDYISIGKLTQAAKAVDIGLDKE